MKTTWKIVFAFFLLLPLAGCEEECNSVNEEVSDPAVSEPIRFWYRDAQGSMITIDQEKFKVTAISDGVEYELEYMVRRGYDVPDAPEGDAGVIMIRDNLELLKEHSSITYKIHYNETEVDYLRIEVEYFNLEDCDEGRLYTFFYNESQVSKSNDISELFVIDKP